MNLTLFDRKALKHEAEYYGISPLVKRLLLIEGEMTLLNYKREIKVLKLFSTCLEMDQSGCGDILFYCVLPAPAIPSSASTINSITFDEQQQEASSSKSLLKANSRDTTSKVPAASDVPSSSSRQIHVHSRTSSWDLRVSRNHGHSRNPSLHSRNSSADLNKFVRNDLGLVLGQIQQNQSLVDPLRVQIIKAHFNWIVVAYSNFFCCWRMRDFNGWKLIFTSPLIDHVIERIAINSKMNLTTSNTETPVRMVAISYGSEIRLWGISEDGGKSDIIGEFWFCYLVLTYILYIIQSSIL